MKPRLYSTLVAVCAAFLMAAPAAFGQADNLRDAPVIADPLPPTPSVIGITPDTTNFTTEPDEFNKCGQSLYGKTSWSLFSVARAGRIDVTAAGIDSVIAINEVNRQGNLIGGPCTDRLQGRIESFPRDNLPTVAKGTVLALQVGGFQRPDGFIEGGPIEVDVELLPPERVQGDAILTWRSTGGGIKVTSIKVDGPQGSAALITCLRKRCGRDQTIRSPKPTGVFAAPIAKKAPASAKSAAGKKAPAPAKEPQVNIAATTAFKGRTVKNGARLVVIVVGTNQIGQAFYWDVKKNAAGAKSLGCVEPDGTSIQRPGTCDGV